MLASGLILRNRELLRNFLLRKKALRANNAQLAMNSCEAAMNALGALLRGEF